MIDRSDRATSGKIEGEGLGVERPVRVLPLDRLGHLRVVEGKRRIVSAVGRIAGNRDVVEREIGDLLESIAARLQPHKLHGRDVLAGGGVLEEGNETRRQSCDVDHQRIELRLAGDATPSTRAVRQLGQFVEGELVNREGALVALDRRITHHPIDLQKVSQMSSVMGVGESREGVMIDRSDRATSGKIEGEGLGVERPVRVLPLDRLGHLRVVEGKRRIVSAVGRIAGNRDVVEREIGVASCPTRSESDPIADLAANYVLLCAVCYPLLSLEGDDEATRFHPTS